MNGYVFETGNPVKALAVIKKYLAENAGGQENAPVNAAETPAEIPAENAADNLADSVKCDPADGSISAQVETKDVPAIVRALVSEGVDVFAVRKTENSLEDAFIAITGGGNTIA